MSGREYNPHDYPLPYVVEDIRQWPICRLTEYKADFIEEVKARVRSKLKSRYPDDQALRNELANVLYQERIRLTEKPWKADPPDERQFWNGLKSKLIKLEQLENNTSLSEDALLDEIVDRYTNEIVGEFNPGAFGLARALLPQFFGTILSAAPGKWFK